MLTYAKIFIVVTIPIIISFLSCKEISLPEEKLEILLYSKFPKGTKREVVVDFIKKNTNYEIQYFEDRPYFHRDNPIRKSSKYKPIGSSYLKVYLGRYQGIPWRVGVTIFIVFDENDSLMIIKIFKDYHGL